MRCSNPMVRPRGICKEDGTYEFINECPPGKTRMNENVNKGESRTGYEVRISS